MSRLARILCFLAAAAACAAAQTIDPSLQQSSTGQSQQDSSGRSSSIVLPQLQTHNPQITNVYPNQDPGADQDRQNNPRDRADNGGPSPRNTTVSTRAPEPDIEFQEFVASSLGARLTIFGQNLFDDVPSTFAPLDRIQVPGDYTIGPGDELLIRAWGQIDVNWRATVDRGGEIYVPKIGSFSVAGVKYDELHDYLQAAIGRIFKNFQMSVSMGRLRSMQIFVVGQVKRPGTYTVSSLASLVDALFASGGPSKHGSIRSIQLKRNGKIISTLDLYDLIVHGDKSKDAKLLPGDVIYVPAVGPLVALAGSVNTPAVFELRDQTTLADVIGYAGGLTNTASGDHVVVERIDERRVRRAEEFKLDPQGLTRELHDGDVIRVLRIPSKFENAVTLRGNVAVPGRYPWRQGMHVHDLIPNREFLITDDYWKHHNQLAVDARAGDFRISGEGLKNDVKRLSSEINWSYAVIQRMNTGDLTPLILSFDLGKAIEGDAQQNLQLMPNDVITIFSQSDMQVPIAERSKFVRLEGELKEAGVYQVRTGETLRQLIERVGGFTPQAYLYGADFTRESTRVEEQHRLDEYVNSLDRSVRQHSASGAYSADPSTAASANAQSQQDLAMVEKMKGLRATGRIVLELKPNAAGTAAVPDLVLEDGDRLLIPFRPATVNVIGSVYNSNAFIYRTGKTAGDYLRLAGGATRTGDRGREFIIRADGSTVSRQQHNTLIGRNFDSLRLMPGDTIIVPEKLDRGATLRAFREYTTILSQFGIAAAGFRALFP